MIIREFPQIVEIMKNIAKETPEHFKDQILSELIEDELENKKRCLVPYESLSIRCNKKEMNKKKVEYLIDDEERKGVDTASSKWLAQF